MNTSLCKKPKTCNDFTSLPISCLFLSQLGSWKQALTQGSGGQSFIWEVAPGSPRRGVQR